MTEQSRLRDFAVYRNVSDDSRRDKRTMIVHMDGERFVFRDDQVDEAIRRASEAESIPAAWNATRDYANELDQ